MSDISSGARVEPAIEGAAAPVEPPLMLRASPPPGSLHDRPDLDQLMRIEDKTARIEEKYARSEALLGRVEEAMKAAVTRTEELARGADVAALREEVAALNVRVRRLPGVGAIAIVALVAALVGAALAYAAIRYGLPAGVPR